MSSHEKTQTVYRILKAFTLIDEARMLLIEAEQRVDSPALKAKMKPLYLSLFADEISYKGGDGKFFNNADIVKEIMNL